MVTWVTVSLACWICGLGAGVEARAASLESVFVLQGVISGHLGDRFVGSIGALDRCVCVAEVVCRSGGSRSCCRMSTSVTWVTELSTRLGRGLGAGVSATYV